MARTGPSGSGWLLSVLGAVVLIAGGFLLGLVVGVVSEEPDLVVEHIAGGSEEVDWAAEIVAPSVPGAVGPTSGDAVDGPALGEWEATEPETTAPVTAAAKPVERPAAPAAPPPPPRALPPRPPEVSAPPPAPAAAPAGRLSGFSVQVGAFSDNRGAEQLASDLTGKGFPAYVTPGPGDGRWRVRVGPVSSRDQGERLAGRLHGDEQLPTWVLSEGAN